MNWIDSTGDSMQRYVFFFILWTATTIDTTFWITWKKFVSTKTVGIGLRFGKIQGRSLPLTNFFGLNFLASSIPKIRGGQSFIWTKVGQTEKIEFSECSSSSEFRHKIPKTTPKSSKIKCDFPFFFAPHNSPTLLFRFLAV